MPVMVGSIFTRLAPRNRCSLLLACCASASLSKPPPAPARLAELAAVCAEAACSICDGSRPTASSAMILEDSSGGSEL